MRGAWSRFVPSDNRHGAERQSGEILQGKERLIQISDYYFSV